MPRLWRGWALGGALIVLGLALFAFWKVAPYELLTIVDGQVEVNPPSINHDVLELVQKAELHLLIPVGLGLLVWRRAYKQRLAISATTAARAQQELDLGLTPRVVAPVAERARPITVRPEPPPRIGDDPFRDPPGPRPIVVERFVKPAPAPIVPGDPDDKPTLLT